MKRDNIKGKNKERRERRKKVSVSICHLLRPDPSRQKKTRQIILLPNLTTIGHNICHRHHKPITPRYLAAYKTIKMFTSQPVVIRDFGTTFMDPQRLQNCFSNTSTMKPKKTLKWTREMKWLMNIKSGQMGLRTAWWYWWKITSKSWDILSLKCHKQRLWTLIFKCLKIWRLFFLCT